ncbi:hypothetical protein BD309DRAFT_223638 [Dichomitus squalens]|nr:hypothetical protein BD309DRAFT_223638 [Dichomitus squalens]
MSSRFRVISHVEHSKDEGPCTDTKARDATPTQMQTKEDDQDYSPGATNIRSELDQHVPGRVVSSMPIKKIERESDRRGTLIAKRETEQGGDTTSIPLGLDTTLPLFVSHDSSLESKANIGQVEAARNPAAEKQPSSDAHSRRTLRRVEVVLSTWQDVQKARSSQFQSQQRSRETRDPTVAMDEPGPSQAADGESAEENKPLLALDLHRPRVIGEALHAAVANLRNVRCRDRV